MVDSSNLKEIEDTIKLYGKIIKEWCRINYRLRPEISVTDHSSFPFVPTSNYYENCLFVHSLQLFPGTKLEPGNIHYVFLNMVVNDMIKLWSNDLQLANADINGYIDELIRSKLITRPGLRMGFFCLLVASKVRLNYFLIEEIEISKILSPQLPYDDYQKRSLLELSYSEDRLRLGLILANELGRWGGENMTIDNCIGWLEDILPALDWSIDLDDPGKCYQSTELSVLLCCLIHYPLPNSDDSTSSTDSLDY